MSRRYNLLSAFAAFLLWGGWAFAINHKAGGWQSTVSAAMQGTASFIITLAMVHLVGFLFRRMPHPARLFLPAVMTVALTGSVLAGLHWLAGTPNIIATIAAPLTVAFCFCLFTAYKLGKSPALREPL